MQSCHTLDPVELARCGIRKYPVGVLPQGWLRAFSVPRETDININHYQFGKALSICESKTGEVLRFSTLVVCGSATMGFI